MKRYNITRNVDDNSGVDAAEDSDGEWVRFKDVERLRKTLVDLVEVLINEPDIRMYAEYKAAERLVKELK